MKTTRPYTMRARAEAVEQTRLRILEATYGLSTRRLLAEITLDAVAESAGVSVQTVLRQFGSKAGLLEATSTHVAAQVADERRAASGDVEDGLRLLAEHYERRGDGVLLLLAQEHTEDAVRPLVERGRAVHRRWVEETFAPLLGPLPGEERSWRTDLLVVATDVYTWKLLRRDGGLSRSVTEERIRRLVTSLLPKEP
jgi:AcrR family transcriptional regulator